MPRPVTLFTGQWADLPFEEVCRLASQWGYDGLEVACWGDHLDVLRAAEDDAYVRERKDLLEKRGLGLWAISNHLTGRRVRPGWRALAPRGAPVGDRLRYWTTTRTLELSGTGRRSA
jgi:sugar phosphate isomerase/epimerase